MSDQPRLRDEDDDPELRALLRARPPLVELPSDVRLRSRQRVRALAAVPVAAGLLVWVQHAALGAALGVAVVAATHAPRIFSRAKSQPPDQAATAPLQLPRETKTAPATAPLTTVNAAGSPQSVPAEVPSAAFPVPAKAGLDAELALLERARHGLERDPATALRLLDRHRSEFVASSLWAEREILSITALVRLGRRTEAEARAESLRQRIPGSLYATRLLGILNERP